MDDLQREIDAYRDEHWGEVLADIEALVKVESVEDLAAAAPGAPFGPGPREALDEALAIAARMGLHAHDCNGYLGYADLPGASERQIGIIGHVDVVPAGPGWSYPPHALSRRDGYLIGRGVIDDKGPLMVALHALKFWKDRDGELPFTVRVLFGANEETNMKDVDYYRAHYADPAFLFTPDSQFPVGYGESGICSGTLESAPLDGGFILDISGGQAVNAVPGVATARVRAAAAGASEALAAAALQPAATGMAAGASALKDLANASPASGISITECADGTVAIEARGASAHASTPELGVNAIGVLVDFLIEAGIGTPDERAFLKLLRALHAHSDGSGLNVACADGHFGALTAVGGMVRLENGRMRQSIDFRYPTATSASAIAERVNECAQAMAPGAAFEMEHDKKPFLMNPDSFEVRALLDAYRTVTGEDAQGQTSKGGTYARCFSSGVSFGLEKPWEQKPEWVGGMHGPDEGVSEALLKEAFSIYARAIGNLREG